MLRIAPAESTEPLDQVRALFREYAASLIVDLCFQSFDAELAGLPGDYAPPGGRLFLAHLVVPGKTDAGTKVGAPTVPEPLAHVAGCIALRPFDATSGEMKRLYVRPAFRGQGVARGLVDEVLRVAREIGYRKILLDTLPEMARAQSLYSSIGFREVSPYRSYSVPGVRFFELPLS